MRNLKGHIDRATREVIEGWVWDPRSHDERIQLELVHIDQQIARTTADLDRPSLVNVGIGDGRHAFRIDLSNTPLLSDAEPLELRCVTTGTQVPGSPFIINASPEQALPLRWHIDEVTDSGIVGWIFAPREPTRRCVLALREGTRLHSRTEASRHRPGLREAGLGDGNCAFLLPMPHRLLDGAEYRLDIVEELSGITLTADPIVWRCTAGTAGTALTGRKARPAHAFPPPEPDIPPAPRATIEYRAIADGAEPPALKTRILFDVSDLIYWISENTHLTGIQRVQSSIILSLLDGALPNDTAALFISWNTAARHWEAVPHAYLNALLRDLFLPDLHRIVPFSSDDTAHGHLPPARPLDAPTILDDGTPSVLCLLGAGWNKPDYFHRVLGFKRRHATRFVMLVHDLVPIIARETCDPATAQVFQDFLRRAVRHTDHFLAVSENTARDLRRYMAGLNLPDPEITVTRNGSSFDAFLGDTASDNSLGADFPARFVLYVSTIEGRKNHSFLLNLWRQMTDAGDNPPHLVCVGRIGWRAESFIAGLVESRYLDGKFILLEDVSDAQLKRLYDECLFTVYPSLYEGWGLPVGEALAAGKICVCSDRASLPEVACGMPFCLPLEDNEPWLLTLRSLIHSDHELRHQEIAIRTDYRKITWGEVALAIAESCNQAAYIIWDESCIAPHIPFATEISFARQWRKAETELNTNGGSDLQCADQIGSHFLSDPLTEINLLYGEECRNDGTWGEPEPWGTWLCSPIGGLIFSLPPSHDGSFVAFMRVRAINVPGGLQAELTVNSHSVWHGILLEKPQNLVFKLNLNSDRTSQTFINFNITTASTSVNVTTHHSDHRHPLLGLEKLIILENSDINKKLDVLTHVLFNSGRPR